MIPKTVILFLHRYTTITVGVRVVELPRHHIGHAILLKRVSEMNSEFGDGPVRGG